MPLVFGVSQIFVGLGRVLDPVLGVENDARALRETGPINSDEKGCSRPSSTARETLPTSTVMNTSAGLLAPSAFIRSINSASLPSIRFTLMPVSLVKAS